MDMEEDHEYPAGIDSYSDSTLRKNVISSNKKRKFLMEQSGFPPPKHNCFGCDTTSRCGPSQKKNFSILDFPPIINHKSEKGEWSITGADSVEDCNSFATNSNSVVSSFESKSEPEITRTCSYGQSSTSFGISENDSIQMDASKEVTYVTASEECDSLHASTAFNEYQNLEILEFGSPADYGFSGYGDEKIEHSEGNELEDTLYLDRINSNMYVLSSGRWSVGTETQSSSRIPTIDQEFEQYFSSLML